MSNPAAIRVSALGLEFAISGLADCDAEKFRHLWAACAGHRKAPDVLVAVKPTQLGWRAAVDDRTWELAGADSAVAAASTAVNTVATARTSLLTLHAAVLSRSDVTVVIPGQSGAGKSTLGLALLQAGWRYVTDEALSLDWAVGPPLPYPRPIAASDETLGHLGLRGVGARSAEETYLVPADLGAQTCPMPPSPSVVVLLDRGATTATRLTPAHRMDALEALMRRGFTTHRDPAQALQVLAEMTRSCSAVRLSYSDARDAAALLGAHFC